MCGMGKGKGAEVEASTLKVYDFAYCTEFSVDIDIDTKFRRIPYNIVNSAKINGRKFGGIPRK
jgi:hypothetical protein